MLSLQVQVKEEERRGERKVREIKFRAWDEQAEVMHNDFKFIGSGDEGNDWIIFISDKRPLTDHKTNPFENPEPYFSQQFKKMQYTGLTDKNGKEIYEGDILSESDCIDNPHSEYYSVYWHKDGCWMTSFKGKYDCDYLYCSTDMGVIGNIYENPELLNG